MLLLHAVTVAAEACTGPLPPAADAWSALVAAEAAAREPVRGLLLRPEIGNWAAYALRRHRGRAAASTSPLWLDLGVVHTVALLASAEAGLPWRTRLPAREGRVMLPGRGMARFPLTGSADNAGAAVVDAETTDGRIRLRWRGSSLEVPAPDAPEPEGWLGLRTVRVEGPPRLAVVLDDVDPFRNLAEPLPPDRLSDAEFASWQKLLGEAWALLCQEHPRTAAAMAEGLVCVVPLPDDGWGIRSASTGEAFGSVLISQPSDATSLALSLVHEFQHTKLGGLMHLSAICRLAQDGAPDLYYAPWRDDPRPLAGLVQGLYAFVGIMTFWKRHREQAHGGDRKLADFEYAYARLQVGLAIAETRRSDRLAPWGEALVQRLSETLESWSPGTDERDVAEVASLLAEFHRAAWLARHMPEPAQAEVVTLAKAYLAGDQPHDTDQAQVLDTWGDDGSEIESVERVAHKKRWSLGLSILIRHHLATPDADVPARLRDRGIDVADSALVRGDLGAARAGYLTRISAAAEDVDAWVGLGLADPSCAITQSRARLVAAVYRRLSKLGAPPDPAELAAWFRPVANARRGRR
jgi:HEXXH motif-containing protein